MKNTKQMSENFVLGISLAVVGGFLDAYTYITRGGVFANAQTGNIVLLGINVAKGDFFKAGHYLIPVVAFAVGILLSEFIKLWLKESQVIHWRQIIIFIEAALLLGTSLIPPNQHNAVVNTAVSFVCALQVQAFRVINNNTVATTMCTGNLRSGTELLFLAIIDKDKSLIRRSFTYYGIILSFIIGAVCGSLLTNVLNTKSVYFAVIILIFPFVLMFKKSENIEMS